MSTHHMERDRRSTRLGQGASGRVMHVMHEACAWFHLSCYVMCVCCLRCSLCGCWLSVSCVCLLFVSVFLVLLLFVCVELITSTVHTPTSRKPEVVITVKRTGIPELPTDDEQALERLVDDDEHPMSNHE